MARLSKIKELEYKVQKLRMTLEIILHRYDRGGYMSPQDIRFIHQALVETQEDNFIKK